MFRAMLCIIMAVAAAQAWVVLSPVSEPAAVGTGSAITYGNGKVWGVFPNPDSDCTYFEYYDPNTAGWVHPEEDPAEYYLENTAITFQWMNDGAVFVVGVEDGDPTLYWYDPLEETWDSDLIEDFTLGTGASIAFRPVPVYSTMDHVPGWLYCLAGNGREFWRYSIPGFGGPVAVDGICPGQGAVIADQTPHFSWQGTGAAQYRLMVSTNPLFSATGTDTVVSATQYDVTNPMENGTYYWRTGTQNGFGVWIWSPTHSFDLEGGWTQLRPIPAAVSDGAALAYEKNYYGDERLIALVGGGGHGCYHYIVSQDTWVESSWTVPYQNVGTALVTHEAASPTHPVWQGPWAIFGEWSDYPYYHAYPHGGWWPDTLIPLPQSLGPGASLAYSIESDTPYLYLIVGESAGTARNDFYRQALPMSDENGGGQAGSTQPARAHVRLINGSGKVTVEYELTAPARVKATVFDAAGRQIRVLQSGPQPAGVHQLCWDTQASDRRTCPGAYFIVLNAGDKQVRLKAVVR